LSARGAKDLADDLAAHAREIDLVLPHHAPVITESDTFLIVAAEPSAPVAAVTQVVHDTVAALFHGPFTHRPERAFIVWVFATPAACAPFVHARSVGAEPRDLSFYDATRGEIFVCTGPGGSGSAAHEVTHALLESDLPDAPLLWLNEGLAALFEAPDFSGGEIHGKAHFRLQTLRTKLASPTAASAVNLPAVFTLTPESFRGPDAYLAYALAREALRWLDSRHTLWAFYRLWRQDILDDATGEKSFASVVGQTPADANDAWVAWLKSPEAEHP